MTVPIELQVVSYALRYLSSCLSYMDALRISPILKGVLFHEIAIFFSTFV